MQYPLSEIAFFAVYASILLVLAIYGGHRYQLAAMYKRGRNKSAPAVELKEWPLVTVQLPMFNEMSVAERIIRATAELDYPADKLQIQVLDDSTDGTVHLASALVNELSSRGIGIEYIHRKDRTGFKAGALENGLKSSRGEFVAVFDADFIPPADFLKRCLVYFAAPDIGMVQARWGHLNRDESTLTAAQSVLLDGHFIIEHTGRNRNGCYFNFNGTAGIWRKVVIADAGGWQHDTLTEDLDLSYRAQLAGWRFVYLPDCVVPAELPQDMNAFKAQQFRWAKGSIQTALKLLPQLLKSDLSLKVKREATFHLTANGAYLLMVLLSALMPLSLFLRSRHGLWGIVLFDAPVFMSATFSVGYFYNLTLSEAGWKLGRRLRYIPSAMALGIGLSVSNARAVVEALLRKESAFMRTPKRGDKDCVRSSYLSEKSWTTAFELSMAAYYGWAMWVAVSRGLYASLPFLSLFAFGFTWVGVTSAWQTLGGPLKAVRFALPEGFRVKSSRAGELERADSA